MSRVTVTRSGIPTSRVTTLDLAVLRLDQPGQLLQAVDQLMQDVRRAGILRVHLVVYRAQGVDGRIDPDGDQVDDLPSAVLEGREVRQRGGRGYGVRPAVGNDVQRT